MTDGGWYAKEGQGGVGLVRPRRLRAARLGQPHTTAAVLCLADTPLAAGAFPRCSGCDSLLPPKYLRRGKERINRVFLRNSYHKLGDPFSGGHAIRAHSTCCIEDFAIEERLKMA